MKILFTALVLIILSGCEDNSASTLPANYEKKAPDSSRVKMESFSPQPSTYPEQSVPSFQLPKVDKKAIQRTIASSGFFVGVFEAYLVANFGKIDPQAEIRKSEDFPCEYARIFDFGIQYTVDGCSNGVLTEIMTFPKVSSFEVRQLVTDIIATPNGEWTADSSFYEVEVGGGSGCEIDISHSSDSTTLTVFCTD